MRKTKTPKGKPFSVRFSAPTERLVEHEARRLKRSKSAVVEAFTEEAARTRRFILIWSLDHSRFSDIVDGVQRALAQRPGQHDWRGLTIAF